MTVDSLKLDGGLETDCAPDSILPRASEGELVIVRRCLQGLEVYDQLLELLLSSIEEVCGADVAEKVRAEGIEFVHRHVANEEIEGVYTRIRSELALKMPAVTARMYREFGAGEPFYVHAASLIRLMTPYGIMKSTQKALSEEALKKHLGKLTLHGPHHDHYQNVPWNALNAWIAIGRVRADNGMFIYPELWGKNLPQGKEAVREDQYLGRPVSIELDRGDALIFHSNHMHSSRLNTTEETRVVLTNRVCLGDPLYPDPLRPQKYYRSSAFPADLNLATVFKQAGFVGRRKAVLNNSMKRVVHRVASKIGLRYKNLPEETANFRDRRFESSEEASAGLSEGEIGVLDEKTCVAKVDGDVVTFRRKCPHEGADLSLGFVENGQIVCPYHGARFCAKTGESNCSAVGSIKEGQRVMQEGKV